MIKHLFLLVFSFLYFSGFTQSEAKSETKRLMDLLTKNEGTYQVQIIDSRELPTIPLSLMDSVTVKRHATETKYVWLKNNVRVKILPVTEINTTNFKSLERVKYITSSELN